VPLETPEPPRQKRARRLIDEKLIAAGWIVQPYDEMDLTAGLGIAVASEAAGQSVTARLRQAALAFAFAAE
jgi:hypothetical protein